NVDANKQPSEVIRQTSHRDIYDRQIEMCGVSIVEVDSPEDIADRVNERTVLMMAYNVYAPESSIRHAQWLEIAAQHGIPTLLDAAADVPPVANLWQFCNMGYDLVVFSGGKAIRGPQSSGLLLGKREFIEAAKLNAVPNEGTVGRVAKVSKEDIVGLHKALELFVGDGEHNGDRIASRCERQLRLIADRIATLDGVDTRFITPLGANRFPHLLIEWNETVRSTPQAVAKMLRDGDPSIATGRVYGTGSEGLLVSAVNLQPNEEHIVADRIAAILSR
ncbi:MAG: hypothetical protein KDB27_34765, partial [Planctomycetales bacterium]|nr:hypothetical protein [Planctomycetales bacterium]